ncbi:hypothetical protein JK359_10530 [Streptomyces actinomycinicus]|uniref:Uncharacterized protein n=1 Tax=Streptomyces actinomycinicus TaxID=1695166 RepID=A0A937EHX8_9ACTN|nr:hypothetical protein [Streptomyces actinomycinicus]MBL1082414.1 hypothetical protein [Streptomyces actinomycinicus]
MALRPAYQRLALIAASTTVVTGGVLLPTTAFAAPPAPPVAAAAQTDGGDEDSADSTAQADSTEADSADSTAQWMPTTDEDSGISAELPGQAETAALDGHDGRAYDVETDYGTIGFAVIDEDDADLQGLLEETVDGYNQSAESPEEALSSGNVQASVTDDGTPRLDADLTSDDGTYGHVTYVVVGDHVLEFSVLGTDDQVDAMQADFDHLVQSIQVADDDSESDDS